MPEPRPPAAPALGFEERALLRRLRAGVLVSVALTTAAGFLRSRSAGWSALIVAGALALNYLLLEQALYHLFFSVKERQAFKGVAGAIARMLLLTGAVFAMIRGSRIDPYGLACGSMTVILAGFFEVAYQIFREIKQRCITKPH